MNGATDASPLMTIPETAAYLGKPVSTVYQWARSGELPAAIRISGRWFVRRRLLERFLAGEDSAA